MKKAHTEVKISPEDIEGAEREYERVAAEANSVYRLVGYSLKTQWGKIPEMVDALTVLLITWNGRFYNPGLFSQQALNEWLSDHLKILSELRERDIATLNDSDDVKIHELFRGLLPVLQPASGKWKDRASPVSVGKSLHLLAPRFFPAWDGSIAYRCGCDYSKTPNKGKSNVDVACEAYVRFCHKIQIVAEELAPRLKTSDKLLLKRINPDYYGPGCRLAKCTNCGTVHHVHIGDEEISQFTDPCSQCEAVRWRELTDDEYAEFILGPRQTSEPLSARLVSELNEPGNPDWTEVQADLLECLETFGEGSLAQWLRRKLKDEGSRTWIATVLNDFYTRDLLKKVEELVQRTMRLNALTPEITPEKNVALYLREATRCYVFGFWDSSVALSRASLEMALKNRLESRLAGLLSRKDDDLNDLLDYARKVGLLDDDRWQKADNVRINGNMVLHGTRANEGLAWDSLRHVRVVLSRLYSRS